MLRLLFLILEKIVAAWGDAFSSLNPPLRDKKSGHLSPQIKKTQQRNRRKRSHPFYRGVKIALLDLTMLVFVSVPFLLGASKLFEIIYDAPVSEISPVFDKQVQGWEPHILKWAKGNELDPNVVAILMQTNSCGDPEAVLTNGRVGLFGVPFAVFQEGDNVSDPNYNASIGLGRFATLYHQDTQRNVGRSFAQYYAGAETLPDEYEEWPVDVQAYHDLTMGIFNEITQERQQSEHIAAMADSEVGRLCQGRDFSEVQRMTKIDNDTPVENETDFQLLRRAASQLVQMDISQLDTEALIRGIENPLALIRRMGLTLTGESVSGDLSPVFSPRVHEWAPDIYRWSDEYDLEPNVIATIMQIESCGNPTSLSHAGAQGLFQVMPFHFSPGENMQDPDTNARRGLTFFKGRLAAANGDLGLAFAQYNGGGTRLTQTYDQWPAETQLYYQRATNILDDIAQGKTYSETVASVCGASGGSDAQPSSSKGKTWRDLVKTLRLPSIAIDDTPPDSSSDYLQDMTGVTVEKPFGFEPMQYIVRILKTARGTPQAVTWPGGSRPAVTASSNYADVYCLVNPSKPEQETAVILPSKSPGVSSRSGHGLHGCSYDLPGMDIVFPGEDTAPLICPITGSVIGKGIDQWRNPYITIANDQYKVTMLHGRFDLLNIGDQCVRGVTPVGWQDTIGNSTGPHVHFTVWDRIAGGWIDPMSVISMTPATGDARFEGELTPNVLRFVPAELGHEVGDFMEEFWESIPDGETPPAVGGETSRGS